MQTSLTVTMERNATFAGVIHTEPYEAGWAREALWFVHVFEVNDQAKAEFVPQISPDGLHWCDHRDAQSLSRLPSRESIRLRSRTLVTGCDCAVASLAAQQAATVKAHIHLVCKS